MDMTWEAGIVLAVSVSIVITNVLTLLVLFRTDLLATTNRYFFASLTIADLLLGLLYTPFSFWAALVNTRVYGDRFCHMQAYLAAVLWIGSLYSLTWLSIDHHIAARKPDRHASLMTAMRSRCWLTMLWVAACSFCCPALLGSEFGSRYYEDAYICIVDWRPQRAYVVTSAVLIVIPPVVTLAAANMYVFSSAYRHERKQWAQNSEATTRHERFVVVSLVTVAYVCTWLPFVSLQMVTMAMTSYVRVTVAGVELDVMTSSPQLDALPPTMHFGFAWLAMANSCIKFVFYVLFDSDFREGLRVLYSHSCCKCVGRLEAM